MKGEEEKQEHGMKNGTATGVQKRKKIT